MLKNVHYGKNKLKEQMEDIEKEIIIEGLTPKLEKEERELLVDFHNTLAQEETSIELYK